MARKTELLAELYQRTQRDVTKPQEWQKFLASACWNYRLSFEEQLMVYAQRPDAAAVLEIERWKLSGEGLEEIGQYRGFALFLSYAASENEFRMVLKGAMSYKIKLGGDASGNITRMDNALGKIPSWLDDERRDLQEVQQQLEATRAELDAPFTREEELEQKSKRLNELNILLNLDQKDKSLIDTTPDEDTPQPSRSLDYER